MATYKVIQDIEAEDKFLGPLTLKQFIYMSIAAICVYLGFVLLSRNAGTAAIFLLPFIFIFGFLGFPWGRDQPTEVWLVARIRFMIKPRKRVWDQDGIQNLVTITAPKVVDKHLTDGLTHTEVTSRLQALANTLDSRGWAVKNVNINLYAEPSYIAGFNQSDRLLSADAQTVEVPSYEVLASDDILDSVNNPVAQHLDQLVNASTKAHREEALEKIKQVRAGTSAQPNDYWFMAQNAQPTNGYAAFDSQVVSPQSAANKGPSVSSAPSAEEQAILERLRAQQTQPTQDGHLRTIDPHPAQPTQPSFANPPLQPTAADPTQTASPAPADPAILNLANNDDLNVATLAREAQRKQNKLGDDEVVISLR